MKNKYEMKINLPNSNTMWKEIEVVDIVRENAEFLIKQADSERYYKCKS
jgi:hypothetical protein